MVERVPARPKAPRAEIVAAKPASPEAALWAEFWTLKAKTVARAEALGVKPETIEPAELQSMRKALVDCYRPMVEEKADAHHWRLVRSGRIRQVKGTEYVTVVRRDSEGNKFYVDRRRDTFCEEFPVQNSIAECLLLLQAKLIDGYTGRNGATFETYCDKSIFTYLLGHCRREKGKRRRKKIETAHRDEAGNVVYIDDENGEPIKCKIEDIHYERSSRFSDDIGETAPWDEPEGARVGEASGDDPAPRSSAGEYKSAPQRRRLDLQSNLVPRDEVTNEEIPFGEMAGPLETTPKTPAEEAIARIAALAGFSGQQAELLRLHFVVGEPVSRAEELAGLGEGAGARLIAKLAGFAGDEEMRECLWAVWTKVDRSDWDKNHAEA
jgi:hypothetical protein